MYGICMEHVPTFVLNITQFFVGKYIHGSPSFSLWFFRCLAVDSIPKLVMKLGSDLWQLLWKMILESEDKHDHEVKIDDFRIFQDFWVQIGKIHQHVAIWKVGQAWHHLASEWEILHVGIMWAKQCHFYHPWLGMVSLYHLYGDDWGMVRLRHCFNHITL